MLPSQDLGDDGKVSGEAMLVNRSLMACNYCGHAGLPPDLLLLLLLLLLMKLLLLLLIWRGNSPLELAQMPLYDFEAPPACVRKSMVPRASMLWLDPGITLSSWKASMAWHDVEA